MRPQITVILAMSVDGKIADGRRSPARFGSERDRAHLQARIAEADAVLFGATTLRAYGTTLPITDINLLQQRQQRGQPEQPIHMVCSQSGALPSDLRFFRQPVPRWLLTTEAGATRWQVGNAFEQVLTAPVTEAGFDWHPVLDRLNSLGIQRIAVTGGGELVASLLAVDCIDQLWITVCPLLLGGREAPTPVEGVGFAAATSPLENCPAIAPRLELLAINPVGQEVFLHYRVVR